ncbi:MAG TPA: FlgD immunoglobulin-like domain containing protein, partial [Candidatus Saccharimonadales bacterium]|nr:FlgD immunoglobulin-like domain containing protein [Candidatus Saccharimonadales bacterium]
GVVTIDIVDLTGRRVRRLDAGSMPGGVQHVAWDGTRDGGERARPGIYFALARAAGSESTARVVLIP